MLIGLVSGGMILAFTLMAVCFMLGLGSGLAHQEVASITIQLGKIIIPLFMLGSGAVWLLEVADD